MKVVYILSSNSPFGGSTKSFLRMFKELRINYGISPLVVFPSKGGAYDMLRNEGVECVSLTYRANIYPQYNNSRQKLLFIFKLIYHWIINLIAYNKLKKIVKKYNPDLIHTNVGVIDLGFRVCRKLNIPHVYHLREYQDLDFGMKCLTLKKVDS